MSVFFDHPLHVGLPNLCKETGQKKLTTASPYHALLIQMIRIRLQPSEDTK